MPQGWVVEKEKCNAGWQLLYSCQFLFEMRTLHEPLRNCSSRREELKLTNSKRASSRRRPRFMERNDPLCKLGHRVPPHPGPLPPGEGETYPAFRQIGAD